MNDETMSNETALTPIPPATLAAWRAACEKASAGPWYSNYSEITDEQGRGPAGLNIGPHEEDVADSFAFSENFSAADGVPQQIEDDFAFIALARKAMPTLLAGYEQQGERVAELEAASESARQHLLDADLWVFTPDGTLSHEPSLLELVVAAAEKVPHLRRLHGEMLAEAERLSAENARLRALLQPFADFAQRVDADVSARHIGDCCPLGCHLDRLPDSLPGTLTLGDCRRIRGELEAK